MIKPISKNKLFQDITEQIISMAKNGTWSLGEKIPGEIELAQQFNVSRNILREALKSLELTGILEAKVGRGTFLTKDALINIKKMELFDSLKNNNSLKELMETRLVIEPELAMLATKNATDEEILGLEKYCLKKDKYTITHGVEFHMELAKLGKNNILYALLSSINDEIEAQRFVYVDRYLDSKTFEEGLKVHRMIYKALKERDKGMVYKLLYEHISNEIEKL